MAYPDDWYPEPDVTEVEASDRLMYLLGELEACCGHCKTCKRNRRKAQHAKRDMREARELGDLLTSLGYID